MKAREIVDKAYALNNVVMDYKSALIKLRGQNDWEDGIDKDERVSVKVLKECYDKALLEGTEFMDTEFEPVEIITRDEGEF